MNLKVTESALVQLELIKKNDFTIQDKVLRLSIDGKECNGFTYALGFSDPNENDNIYIINENIELHYDPFVASLFESGEIDYILNPIEGLDGFIIINHKEHLYKGKFFKDPNNIPSTLKE